MDAGGGRGRGRGGGDVLPYLAVLSEGGRGGTLLGVGLGQAGADLQQVGLSRLGDHHGVVEGCGHGALRLGLALGKGGHPLSDLSP